MALAATLTALAARFALDPLLGLHVPYVTVYIAVAVTAWFSRRLAPGLLAVTLGGLLAQYFFAYPKYSLRLPDPQQQLGLATYLMAAFTFLGFGQALQRKHGRAIMLARESDEQRGRLRATLASIGDAVIATDADGNITFMNTVAARLTGWTNEEARARPLETVFRIIGERTRQPAVNPVTRALREGIVVGLANHSILVARDGTERSIDDSAAPIHNESGATLGCVLVFRDMSERRRIEATLRESESRKTAILSSALDVIITMDHLGKVVDCNSAVVEIFGYRCEDIVGRPLAETIIPERLREAHYTGLARYLATGKGTVLGKRIELTGLHADGRELPVELSITRVAGIDPPLFTGTIRDISERRQLERERLEHEQRFRSFIEQVKDYAIFTTDPNGRPTSWNEGVKRVFGFNEADFLGQDVAALIFTPEDIETGVPQREFKEAAENGRASNDRWMRRKDGTRFYAAGTTTSQRNDSGELMGFTKVARDQTERKRAEEANSRLASIVDSSDDAIISKDLNGIITTWNKSAERLFGYAASEAVGRSITVLIPPDRLEEESHILDRIRRGQQVENFESIRIRKDGTPLDMSLTISPLRNEQGQVIGASKIGRNITDRKESERELARLLRSESEARGEAERAGRLKDDFLATLSHELRTPLSAILGWARLIEKNPSDSRTLKDGIAIISKSAKMQTDLISDLLDMSRIVSGKIRLEIEDVSLSDLVLWSIDSVRPAAEAKKIQIQAAISTVSEPVRGDPTRLQQVFWNLLSNAVKFTPKGGRIQVVVAKRNSHAEIQVSDTGKGIKSEFLPYVFDRFRQADASTTREQGGLGLGLAIVKNLVELHGGGVRAESEGEGLGSTFTVGLPLSPVRSSRFASAEAPNQALVPVNLEGVQVLAVDDDPDTRNLLKRILQEHSADVLTAASAEEALTLLEEHQPHIVLSDIGMPEMDGYDFLRRLRQSGNQIPAVAVTAFARSEDRTKALIAGYHGHVTKPVEPNELVATVAAFAKTFPRRGHQSD